MKTIAITNLKGGVGKTTTAISMGHLLSQRGYRVLLVDTDHQANLTAFFRLTNASFPSLTDLFEGMISNLDDLIAETATTGALSVIKSDIGLSALEFSGGQTRQVQLAMLRDLVSTMREAGEFDYIIFDLPPAFSLPAIAALYAADEVIIPLKPGRFEMDGLSEIVRQVDNVRAINPHIKIRGALITLWHKSEVCSAFDAWRLRSGRHSPARRWITGDL